MNLQPGKRVLIFVVAYEAERHLASVLDRIPRELTSSEQVQILVIDDGSTDQGVQKGKLWAEQHGCKNITILRNPVNQGYGGNQKIGYRIALDAAFDFVILLHGDGQYAPELLPEFIRVWQERDADVVIGSRMQSLTSARKGGMPWYKLAGNRTLTSFQNALTGQALSEYHSGYRGYSTRFLAQVPFEIDTNDFHFDTEILLQAFNVRAKVEEFAIPTHYGDEICRVNGMRYARDVVLATLRYRCHQFGILCDLKYRRQEVTRYEDKTYMAYSSHAMALKLVGEHRPAKLLDIGCGPGFLSKRCQEMGIEVTAVDMAEPSPGMLKDFRKADLERDRLPADAFDYDLILMLDVIEHLAEPERFLLDLRNHSRASSSRGPEARPTMVLSTPNVAFAAIRLSLLLGRFNYAERGILDITHKRLFTRKALLTMLRECGYDVDRLVPVGVPFEAVCGGAVGRILNRIAAGLARLWPAMFAFQLMVVCRPRPGVAQLRDWSERHHLPAGELARNLLHPADKVE